MREWSCSDSFDAVSLSHSLSLILVHITVYVYSPLLCTSQQWKLQRTNNLHFHWPQSLSNTHTKNSQNWFHKKKNANETHENNRKYAAISIEYGQSEIFLVCCGCLIAIVFQFCYDTIYYVWTPLLGPEMKKKKIIKYRWARCISYRTRVSLYSKQ